MERENTTPIIKQVTIDTRPPRFKRAAGIDCPEYIAVATETLYIPIAVIITLSHTFFILLFFYLIYSLLFLC
jgi:hypothetical protein